ncbi:MAG: hypothetical protein KJ954_14330 [Alphaproteobacteria bacterium]|nr:hypothetical protein [Alphaproteobacteria bacterium]
MDYSKYISTPATTTEAAPLITRLLLTEGRLVGGFLYFPYGPAGVLHFLARIKNQQILPYNAAENFRLDDCVVNFSLGIDLNEPPWVVDLVTWNDSTSLAHVLTVCFFLDQFTKPR